MVTHPNTVQRDLVARPVERTRYKYVGSNPSEVEDFALLSQPYISRNLSWKSDFQTLSTWNKENWKIKTAPSERKLHNSDPSYSLR